MDILGRLGGFWVSDGFGKGSMFLCITFAVIIGVKRRVLSLQQRKESPQTKGGREG